MPPPLPVMTEKYIIPLVVEGDDSPPLEVRIGRKQTGEHPTDCLGKASCEVGENQLGMVVRGLSDILNSLANTPVRINMDCLDLFRIL